MSATVHLVNGQTTADILIETDVPGDILVWADALDLGPLAMAADADSASATQAQRAAFWAQVLGGNVQTHAATLQGFRDAVTQASAADEVALWYEHDVFDQFALVAILHQLGRTRHTGVSMISIDRHPEVPQFVGLGQLSQAALFALWPTRVPVAKDAWEEAAGAWTALTAADPRALPFVAKRVRALPFLASALERWLEEFPDVSSGLARTERQVLAAIARGTGTPAALVAEVTALDPRYPATDVVLRLTLEQLARAELIAPATTTGSWVITTLGHDTLAAKVDRIARCGIDRWLGGVHLAGRGPLWRWDGSERRLVWR